MCCAVLALHAHALPRETSIEFLPAIGASQDSQQNCLRLQSGGPGCVTKAGEPESRNVQPWIPLGFDFASRAAWGSAKHSGRSGKL